MENPFNTSRGKKDVKSYLPDRPFIGYLTTVIVKLLPYKSL